MYFYIQNTGIDTVCITLAALSFWMIFASVRFFAFSHAIAYTLGAYSSLLPFWHNPVFLPLSFVVASLIGAVWTIACHFIVFEPFERKHGSALILMLASLGLYIIAENVLALSFGAQLKAANVGYMEGVIALGVFRMRLSRLLTIVLGGMLLCSLLYMICMSTIGKRILALGENPELARAYGFRIFELRYIGLAIGGATISLLGFLVALDSGVRPGVGMNPLLIGIILFLLCGLHRAYLVPAAALALSVAKTTGGVFVGMQWVDPISYGLLLCFCLVFLSQRLEKMG